MILQILVLFPLAYTLYKFIMRKIAKPSYANKTIWITGASSGIGEYLAYQFSKCGGNLILSARNVKELQRVKAGCQHPQKIQVVKLDMTDYQQIEEVTQKIISKLQSENRKLDVVIQNAGVSMRCQFRQYSFSNHISMLNVNVHGPYKHIQCFVEHMIKNKSGQIVAITSAAGKLSTTYRSSYAGSKHALIGIFDSLRSQLHEHNIKVTNIMPGYIETNISKNALGAEAGQKFGATDQNIKNGMKADKFAKEAVQAIYNGEQQLQISGSLAVPFAILLRNICPDLFFVLMRRNGKNQSKAVKNKSL